MHSLGSNSPGVCAFPVGRGYNIRKMSQTFYAARPDHLLTKPCETLKSSHNLAALDRICNQILWGLIRECKDAPNPASPFTAEGEIYNGM